MMKAPTIEFDNDRHTPRITVVILAIAWILAVVAFATARLRVQSHDYLRFHRYMDSVGVPASIRNLDSLVIYVGAAILGAFFVSRIVGGHVASTLCLSRADIEPAPPRLNAWGWMVVSACAPMLVVGVILGLPHANEFTLNPIVSGTISAPVREEFLYRGLLVAAPALVLGWMTRAFYINVVLASLLFGAAHITWSWAGLSNGWPALLVTFLGGIWYSWLLAKWRLLWVPMALHAGMNLGWTLSGASGGAGGGGWAINIARVATIVIASVWTIRAARNASVKPIAA